MRIETILTAPWRFVTRRRLFRYLLRKIFRPQRVTIDGIVIQFTPDVVSPAIVQQIYTEYYEEAERHLVGALVEAGDSVLELGSGLGFISSVIGRQRPKIQVSVEADPRLYPLLRKNLENNGVTGAEVLSGIVGAHDGEVDFFSGDHFIGSSLHRTGEHSDRRSVHCHAIAPLFERFAFNCLIIDVEGAEHELLDVLPLAGVDKLCIELHPHIIGPEKVTRVVARLLEAGFLLDLQQHSGQVLVFRRCVHTERI